MAKKKQKKHICLQCEHSLVSELSFRGQLNVRSLIYMLVSQKVLLLICISCEVICISHPHCTGTTEQIADCKGQHF